MQDSLNYANDTVKRKQAKMRDFISQTGQSRDYFREQNYGNFQSSIDYMSRFTPKYSDQKKITTGTINMHVKKVSNSRFDMVKVHNSGIFIIASDCIRIDMMFIKINNCNRWHFKAFWQFILYRKKVFLCQAYSLIFSVYINITKNMSYNNVKKEIDRKIYDYIESKGGNFFAEENLSGYVFFLNI